MCEGGFILNVCFLIALVATSPIPQEVNVQTYPGAYCDQSAFRNSLIGSLNEERTSDKTLNQIASLCPSHPQNDILLKILYDRITSNPLMADIINDIQHSNNGDISNHIQNPKNAPNIVNNYIILPLDFVHGGPSSVKRDINTECLFNNPNICARVKKDAGKQPDDLSENSYNRQTDEGVVANTEKTQPIVNNNKNMYDDQLSNSKMLSNITANNQKGNIKQSLKRPSQKKSQPTQRNYTLNTKNIDSTELLEIESGNQVVNKTKKLKIKSASKSMPKDKQRYLEELKNTENSYKSTEKIDKRQQRNKSPKSTSSRKNINGVTEKNNDQVNGKQAKTQTDEVQKNYLKSNDSKRPREKQSNLIDDRRKQKMSDTSRSKNTINSLSINQDYRFPNMPYDSTTMYKYIDAIMSNYQLSNGNYKHDFPFNYNNFYQFPQLSNPTNSKKTSRTKSHKRRKQPKSYRRKHHRKRVFSKRKPSEKKVIEKITGSLDGINPSSNNLDIVAPIPYSVETNKIPQTGIIKKDNETVISFENILEQKNFTSREEKENIVTTIFDELSLINNSLSEETYYNSYPSFIVGMDDKVPIIFENSLLDDYYPEFTADNEALQLTTEETHPTKYHGDKYYYVSNNNFDFGDYVKKRKRIALKNLNKKSNLFFSDTEGNRNLISINHGAKGNKENLSTIQFQSPLFLDNPDFRTRKIDSNEIYEPYHHHNIYQDPDEDFDKYYEGDKAVVYSTPMSPKDSAKTTTCNDIDHGLTSKWRKIKDSNVETVYAPSKLAKYGPV